LSCSAGLGEFRCRCCTLALGAVVGPHVDVGVPQSSCMTCLDELR
jgi:hypothetical protein